MPHLWRKKAFPQLILALLSPLLSGCHFYDYMTGETPAKYVREMEDPYFADERREGINGLVAKHPNFVGQDRWAFTKQPPYTTRYKQLAEDDPDYVVRMTAVRALNRARDASATPVFISALSDHSEWVRLEGAKALVNLPDPKAVPALIKIIQNPEEQRDVRIAAADALKHYKTLEVARSLVVVLSAKEFGIAWQANNSLKNLTGEDKKYDQTAWLEYLTGPAKPFG